MTSLAQANFPTIPELLFGPQSGSTSGGFGGWLTQIGILQLSDPAAETQILTEALKEISGKYAAGFPISITDVWARLLARHFVNGTTAANFNDTTLPHGAGVKFSDIASLYVIDFHT